MPFFRSSVLLLSMVAGTVGPSVLNAADESQWVRGQKLYEEGLGLGQVMAVVMVDEQRVEVPADTLPCAGCHGSDRLGRSEEGVKAPALRWSALTEGRVAGAYTRTDLVRAIAAGVDPEGKPLSVSMPRYRMSQQDMRDLVAYLSAE